MERERSSPRSSKVPNMQAIGHLKSAFSALAAPVTDTTFRGTPSDQSPSKFLHVRLWAK